MTTGNELVLMDRNRVQRSLKRMAYQIAEDNRTNREVCLIGIKKRGFITAAMLGFHLSEIYERELPVLNLRFDESNSGEMFSDLDIDRAYPLVVDDVIFSGKTMFTALNTIYALAPFPEIHSVVLVDRGHRKFPVQAHFKGLEYSTKLKEHVSVITENDRVEKVVIDTS